MDKRQNQPKYRRHASLIRRPLLTISIVLIIAIITTISAVAISRLTSTSSENTLHQPTVGQDDDDASSSPSNSGTSTHMNESEKNLFPQDGASANQLDYLTGYISSTAKIDGYLMLRAGINQFLSKGTCTLTLTSSTGSIYTQSTSIMPDPSSSYCDGFDIPLSELVSGDEYQIKIDIISDQRKGVIEGKVSI